MSATLKCRGGMCGVCAWCRKELKAMADVTELPVDSQRSIVQSDLVRQILSEPRAPKPKRLVRPVQNRRKETT